MQLLKMTLIVGFLAIGVSVFTASGAAVSGIVVDEKGNGVTGASVVYSRLPTFAWTNGHRITTTPSIGSTVTTSTAGTFSVSGLPTGTYDLCAAGPKETHLGSCEWGPGAVRIDLLADQTASVKLGVTEGALITFHVADPHNQIVDLEDILAIGSGGNKLVANFGVGVWAGTRYFRARRISTVGVSRVYQLAMPKSGSVRLFLDTGLSVLDEGGASAAVRRLDRIIAPVGQSIMNVNLTIR